MSESISKIKALLNKSTEKFIIQHKVKRGLSPEQVVVQVKKLFFIYTCCQEELSSLVVQSGLKELGEILARVKMGYKHMLDALLENCNSLEEQVKIEISRKTQHIFEGHPLRDAPKEIKVNYWGMHQPKLKFTEDPADKMDFGDEEEKKSREKAERERIELKVNKLIQKIDNGERVDLEEIEDYKTGFEYCRRLCDSIKVENEEMHAKMFVQLRSIENTQSKMGTNALEAVEVIQSELINVVAPSLQSKITSTPKPDINPAHYDDNEREFLESFTGKYKVLALQILDKIYAAKLSRPSKNTETQLSSVHINQMSHSNEGKLILKIAKLEFALSEANKQTSEVKIRSSMLESLNNELVQEITRRENEILELYYKMGMTSSDNAIRERMKDLEELKNRTFGIVATESGGSIAKYQAMVQQTLMKIAQLGGDVLAHSDTDETAKIVSDKFKNAIKEITKNLVPDDLKTGLKREDPFGMEDAMRISLSPPKMLPKIKLSKKDRDQLMGGIQEPSMNRSSKNNSVARAGRRDSKTGAPQFSDDEYDPQGGAARDKTTYPGSRKPRRSNRQENGILDSDRKPSSLNPLAKFVSTKLLPRKSIQPSEHGDRSASARQSPDGTSKPQVISPNSKRDGSPYHGKPGATESELSVDQENEKPKPSKFSKLLPVQDSSSSRQAGGRTTPPDPQTSKNSDVHDHLKILERTEVKYMMLNEEFLTKNPVLKEDLLKLMKLAIGLTSVQREYRCLIGKSRIEIIPSEIDKRDSSDPKFNIRNREGKKLHPDDRSDQSFLDSADRNSPHRTREGRKHQRSKTLKSSPKGQPRIEDQLNQETSDYDKQTDPDIAGKKLRETGFSRWKHKTDDGGDSLDKQRAASLQNLTREQRGLLRNNVLNETQKLTDSQKYMLKKYGGRPGDKWRGTGPDEGTGNSGTTGIGLPSSSSHFNMSGLYALDGIQRVRTRKPNYDFDFYNTNNQFGKRGTQGKDSHGDDGEVVDQQINPFFHLTSEGEVDDQFIVDMYDVIEEPRLDLSHQTVIPRDVIKRNPQRVQELKTKVNQFVKAHFSCGTVCKHLVAFYQRIGLLKAVGWYHNGKRQLMLPHVDIGDSKILLSLQQRKVLNNKLKLWTVMYMKHMPIKLA